jgi:uncharacterized protein (TIGR00304 family)
MVRARELQFLAVCMLVGGLALLVVAAINGDADLSIFLIFPVISGTGAAFAIGALLFVVGIFLAFFAFSLNLIPSGVPASEAYVERRPRQGEATDQSGRPHEGGSKFGGVVFIGPIPIVFGSGPKMGRLMLVASIVIAIFLIVFILGALWI